MRRTSKWKAAGVFVLVGLLGLTSQDCASNRLVLANASSGPVDILARVRDEVVWDGTLESQDEVYVPYALDRGLAAYDVEVRYAEPARTDHYRIGYVVPYSQRVNFVLFADDSVHASSWQRPLAASHDGFLLYFWHFMLQLSDLMSCVDRDLVRALGGGT